MYHTSMCKHINELEIYKSIALNLHNLNLNIYTSTLDFEWHVVDWELSYDQSTFLQNFFHFLI